VNSGCRLVLDGNGLASAAWRTWHGRRLADAGVHIKGDRRPLHRAADTLPHPAGHLATSATRPAATVGPRPLGPPCPASPLLRDLPHGCPTGVAAHGAVWSRGRRKCLKGIDLMVPEEGVEPSLPVQFERGPAVNDEHPSASRWCLRGQGGVSRIKGALRRCCQSPG